jgi:thiamine monophosphate synthase|tara:strand:+ start:6183 stop:6761 length:579 start_codon:yes stop_codon:yes gene_type:complete
MHKNYPKYFIFLDHYNSYYFNHNNINIGIIYRNYNSSNREIELRKIAKACREKRYKLYVSNDIKLALKFKSYGIYIPSFNKTAKYMNLENKNLDILGSAHNYIEIKNKISQKCRAIFISPIFPVKKNNNFLNIYKFNLLSLQTKNEVFALGGISEKNFNKLKLLKINGFGGISLFKKKPAYKRPAFLKNFFF